jgi:dihydroorotate dehydrogenase electron transfer subunit
VSCPADPGSHSDAHDDAHATRPSRIVSNRRVGPGWFVLRLEDTVIARRSRPGQFVQIRVGEGESFDPLLRRPFSVYDVDRKAGTYDILYTAVGRGTRWMAGLPDAPGGAVDVEGPFGNEFAHPDAADRVYLVGGGVGVAPLYFFAKETIARGGSRPPITLCVGARSRGQLQGIDDFRKLPIRAETATDDGSDGFHGRVTALFAKLLAGEPDAQRVRVYGCGPQGMNESLRALAVEKGLRCEICLEALMACGFGVCFGCVLPIRKELGGEFYNRRTCYEGPVFDARLLHPGIE